MRNTVRHFHGVAISLVRLDRARAVQKVFVDGHRVWTILKDGSVGLNDNRMFKWAWGKSEETDPRIANALLHLGAITKDLHDKIAADAEAAKEKRDRKYAASDLKAAAEALGIKLTTTQLRQAAR